MRSLGIRPRLLLSFAVVALVCVIMLCGLAVILVGLGTQVKGLFGIEYLVEADRDAYQSHLAILSLISSRKDDKEWIKKQELDARENLGQVKTRYGKFKAIYQNQEKLTQLFQDFEASLAKLEAETEYILGELSNGALVKARARYEGNYGLNFSQARELLNEFTDLTFSVAIKQNKLSSMFLMYLYPTLIGSIAALAFCVIGLGLYSANSISRPVIKLVENLKASSSQIRDASRALSDSSQRMAGGVGEQAASVQKTSAAMLELASLVRSNASNAKEANELANRSAARSSEGSSQMDSMLLAIQDIEKSSDEIQNVIDLIEDIAFQTNMLALNAAVEAARAGEAGMGFSVVADEVKSLANRSSESAKDTARMIKQTLSKTSAGGKLATALSATIVEIRDDIQGIAQMFSECLKSSDRQSLSLDQINLAVGQFEQLANDNSGQAASTASSAEELMSQVSLLDEAVTSLSGLVNGEGGRTQKAQEAMPPSGQIAYKPA